jgi:hypothetical protein
VLASGLKWSGLPPQKNRPLDARVCRLNYAAGSNDTGKWRPTPPKFKPAGGVQWATMKVRPPPFTQFFKMASGRSSDSLAHQSPKQSAYPTTLATASPCCPRTETVLTLVCFVCADVGAVVAVGGAPACPPSPGQRGVQAGLPQEYVTHRGHANEGVARSLPWFEAITP